jgi:hypothetical protein
LIVDSPEERRAWIETVTAGRKFGSGLTIESAPTFSVKDLAAREALAAYEVGLSVCVVLTSYAACEIRLVETLISLLSIAPGIMVPGDPETHDRVQDELHDAHWRTQGIEGILKSLSEAGHWIGPEIREDLLVLGSHKNDLAHYRRPFVKETRRTWATAESSVMSELQPTRLIDPKVQEAYARHAITTLQDLWYEPTASGPLGVNLPADWRPTGYTRHLR